jgi:hypothetical protein
VLHGKVVWVRDLDIGNLLEGRSVH